MKSRPVLLLFCCLVLVPWIGSAADEPAAKAREVRVARPVVREVTEYEDFTGRVAESTRVEVRARVTGYLVQSPVKDGAEVKQGDTLFEIDARPYRAQLEQAEAALALAESRLKLAAAAQKRTAALVAQKTAAQEELDRATAERDVAEAGVLVARASVLTAKLNVDWTIVRAPIAGRMGRRFVDPGNLVIADQTALGLLVSSEPIYVYFEVDERSLLRMKRAEGLKNNNNTKGTVSVALATDEGFPHQGTVDFQDNLVNADTGTLRLRAILPNKDRAMTPGMFARVRMALGEPQSALLVSSQSVFSENGARLVLVVNDKDAIEKRKVVLGQDLAGLRVIKAGLKPEDRVVIERSDGLRPGVTVRPRLEPMPAQKPEPSPNGAGAAAPSSLRGQPGAGILVDASYPGASAEVVSETVRAPIEQQVGGLEKLQMMRSRCTNDGRYALALFFDRGSNLNLTQVLVQNRLALALPVLPAAVQNAGISVLKGPSGVVLIVNLLSPDETFDALFLSNYAIIHLKDELSRLPGVAAVSLVGHSETGLSIWLDPEKLAARGLNAGEVVQVIDKQKAAGNMDPEKLADLVIRTDPVVRLKDVGRAEFSAGRRPSEAILDGKPVVSLVVHPFGETNLAAVRASLQERLNQLRTRLPKGLDFNLTFDFTANHRWPDQPTTPEYLLIDVDVPTDSSAEKVRKSLTGCGVLLREIPGVQHVLALSENPFDLFGGGPCVLVRLTPAEQRKAGRPQMIRTIRARLEEVKEISVRIRDLSGSGKFPRCGYPVDLAVSGPDLGRVRQWATKLADRLGQDKKLTDVWMNRDSAPRPQLYVDIDREAAASRGVSLEDISTTLQVYTGLGVVNAFNKFGRSWRIDLQYERGSGELAKDIRQIKVRNSRGQMIPLGVLATVRETDQPRAPDFLETLPMVEITANLASGTFDDELRKACETASETIRKDLGLPADYRLTWLREMPAGK